MRCRACAIRSSADERVGDIRNYIKKGKLWEAFESEERVVLLIDEIDKADIEFPNDLLQELDRMEFFVYELSETIVAKKRPIVVITSNNEKELPDAFLRRCFFHYINFPDRETMHEIIEVHHPGNQAGTGEGSHGDLLRCPQGARPEEETLHLGTHRLAETLDVRRHPRRDPDQPRPEQGHTAPLRRPGEERAGRAPPRNALHS